MSALAFTNYEPREVKEDKGHSVVQAVVVTDEQVLESVRAIGGNTQRSRSTRVARLIAEALKSGDKCPD